MTDLSDPIAAFRAAVDVLNDENWFAAADVVDPVSLQFFVEQFLARVAPPHPPHQLTADDFMARDPELPGIDSVETLRALSPKELLAAWLDGRSMRRQVERLAATGQISTEVAERRASEGFAMYEYAAIGAVPDGDDIAYVLYRRDIDHPQPSTADVAESLLNDLEDIQRFVRDLSMHRQPSLAMMRRQADGTWRLVLDHDYLNVSSFHITGISIKSEDRDGQ